MYFNLHKASGKWCECLKKHLILSLVCFWLGLWSVLCQKYKSAIFSSDFLLVFFSHSKHCTALSFQAGLFSAKRPTWIINLFLIYLNCIHNADKASFTSKWKPVVSSVKQTWVFEKTYFQPSLDVLSSSSHLTLPHLLVYAQRWWNKNKNVWNAHVAVMFLLQRPEPLLYAARTAATRWSWTA